MVVYFAVFLVLNFVILGECMRRPFYNSAMCERKGSADCSFQMTSQNSKICTVYNTTECRNFNFSNWMRHPSKHPTLQSDSVYSVDVCPYALTNDDGSSHFFSALNVIFTTSNKDISGYALLLENSDVPVNICRIFDFRNSGATEHGVIFYDCLVSLTSYGVQNFQLTVKALPHNEEMQYSLFLPDVHNIETNNICQWKPLVMVFNGGFQNNIVEVKFSQAPEHFNVSSYEVSILLDPSYEPVQTVTIEASEGELVNVMFFHVDRGWYSIYVKPLSSISSHDCSAVRYTVFFIENKVIDKIILICIIAVCLLGFGIAISVQLFLRWLFRPGPIKNKPVALLVYSFDCREHNHVVLRYARYLEKQCGIQVLTIYEEQRNDLDLWISGPYKNSNIIMIIVSEGVFYKCRNSNNPAMKECYPCGDRLLPALAFLKTEMLKDKKQFIQVYFEYSGTHHIHSTMQSEIWGKAFAIPQEMNHLLCEAYNQGPKISCLGVYPRMPGHDVVSSPEGMALIESIEEVKEVLNENFDTLQTLSEVTVNKPKKYSERPRVHRDEKEMRNSNCGRSTYFPELRQPQNLYSGEEKGYIHSDLKLNAPSKRWCSNDSYAHEHECEGENCANLHLLQDSELCTIAEHKLDPVLSEMGVQKNYALDVLGSTEDEGDDSHLQDLQFILSKPGPSFPCLQKPNFFK